MKAQHKHALATLHSQLEEEKADEESRIEEDRRALLKSLSQKVGTEFLVVMHQTLLYCFLPLFSILKTTHSA